MNVTVDQTRDLKDTLSLETRIVDLQTRDTGGGIKLENNIKDTNAQSIMHDEDIWTESDEILLKQWAYHALIFSWLHEKTSNYYGMVYNWMQVPVIILTGLLGLANVGQNQISSLTIRDIVSILLALLGFFTTTIQTLIRFFEIAENKQRHLSASKNWDRLHENIKIELSKPRNQRTKGRVNDRFKKDFETYKNDTKEFPELVKKSFFVTFNKIDQDIQLPIVLSKKIDTININTATIEVVVQPPPISPRTNIIERFKATNERDPTIEEVTMILQLRDMKQKH
jgi:hypothetical protein